MFCQRFLAAGLSLQGSVKDSGHTNDEQTILGRGLKGGKMLIMQINPGPD